MTETSIRYVLSRDDTGQRAVLLDGNYYTTLQECIAAAEGLVNLELLLPLCDILNYLARGRDYALIKDPDAFSEQYLQRLQSEDFLEPYQENKPRLSDFGVVDLGAIQLPKVVDQQLCFYVSDDFTGLPYSVTCPWPPEDASQLAYEPVPAE